MTGRQQVHIVHQFRSHENREAISSGADMVCGSITNAAELSGVAILDHVTSDMSITQADIFAPVLSFIRVESAEQALRENSKCPYALSATSLDHRLVVSSLHV